MAGLTSAFISHQIWLQRTASHEANLSIPFIQQMRDEVKDAVLKFGDDSRTAARLNKMLRELDDILRGIAGDWNDVLLDDLQELAKYEADWTTKTLELNVDANFTTPSPDQVWAAIKFDPLALGDNPVEFNKLLTNWTEKEVNRLTVGVRTGFSQGLTTRQIVKDVVGSGESGRMFGGMADVSQRNAMTTVRTAISHVSTQAKQQVYEKNDDIVEGYELVVTLDSRTSAICRGWPPGKVYKLTDKYQPLPPFHPNERTTTVPVISSDFDFLDVGAKRAARGSEGGQQVSADMSYYEFFAKQPAWWQDQAIGPVRGKIFRNSGLTPEEFRSVSIDGFNRPMTIEQMAAADKRVADYLSGK